MHTLALPLEGGSPSIPIRRHTAGHGPEGLYSKAETSQKRTEGTHEHPHPVQRYLEDSAEVTRLRNLSSAACMAGLKSPG